MNDLLKRLSKFWPNIIGIIGDFSKILTNYREISLNFLLRLLFSNKLSKQLCIRLLFGERGHRPPDPLPDKPTMNFSLKSTLGTVLSLFYAYDKLIKGNTS